MVVVVVHAKSLVAGSLVAFLLFGARGHGATQPGLLLEGTVVTMDAAHHVLRNGRVLVRDGLIAGVWSGAPPAGVSISGTRVVRADLIYPGLIDLHDHPSYDVLPLWLPPVRYDTRYQWSLAPPASFVRLVQKPHAALAGLQDDVLLYREAQSALAGETALEGVGSPGVPAALIREIEGTNFGRAADEAWVPSIGDFTGAAGLRDRIATGATRAWIVHLAEGVREADRHELDVVRTFGLLTSALVVVHGTALQRADLGALAAAGAKLVWSPTSNLLLYGRTARIYDALAEGVDVSLGTDWTPSGSPTLLDELKVADITLRDRRLLGRARTLAQATLDRLLVDMVTRNPARAAGWAEVGSLEPGMHADVLMLRRPRLTPTGGMPASPYRSLIDATQRDVRLVLLDGVPLAGDSSALRAAGAQHVQLVRSTRGRFTKGVVAAPLLAAAQTRLRRVLRPLHVALLPLFTVDDRGFLGVLGGHTKRKPNFVGVAGDPFARFAARWYTP
jgi:5-methylthioadenosine/S-adenosylhomocysteine deaminase